MGKYSIYITNESQERLADISALCIKRRFVKKRNRPEVIDITLSVDGISNYLNDIGLDISDVFRVNENEIHIYRYDTQEIAGQIGYMNVGLDSQTAISVTAFGWLELFNQRITGILQTYTAEDIGAIMWDLIDTSQNEANGNFGITQGTIQTSRDADRTYEYKNIKDALIQLTEVNNAPDLEFTPTKVFNVYYPKIGTKRDDIVFTYPGNIIEIGFSQDGSKMGNQIIASGSGFGSDRLLSIAGDTSLQQGYGLRQKIVQYPDVSIADTLDSHAEEELRTWSRPFTIPRLRINGNAYPEYGSYDVGDEVVIQSQKYQRLLEPALGYYRIESIAVTIDENDFESVDLELSKV